MTTIRDMLISDLRAIGAAGVAWGPFEWAIEDLGSLPEPPVDRLSGPAKEAALIFARPAFRDADGSLVPLPDGWSVEDVEFSDEKQLRTWRGSLWASVECSWDGRGRWKMGATGLPGLVRWYPTAPSAWRAAEQWIKEQGR